PVYADGGTAGTGAATTPSGAVRVSPEKQQVIGLKVERVDRISPRNMVRFLGRVAADERRVYFINATIDGWITKTYSNSTGSLVRKNEVLATFYSPEFLSAGQALLFALSSMDRVQATGNESPAQKDQLQQFNINLKQYRDSLKNLGMGDVQIEEMIRTRRFMENVNITSPADGFIISRKVSEGQRFDKGTELYQIADLRRVWILVDTYGNESQYFHPGQIVPVRCQGKMFTARVSKVLPQFDPATRTLKVRLEADNPGFALRPDMFVDVEFPVRMPTGIIVPADAVLDSGLKKTVFVERGNGYFEPRAVETGNWFDDRVEIVRGLAPGERIVVSGNFLLDSESRMRAALE
ncbi:efflux RND transporter periplasmic adaptor subunit, partial [bacterium]